MQKSKTVPNNAKFEIRPASSEEAGLFYALQPEQSLPLLKKHVDLFYYACASGMSWLALDSKGDLARNYGTISQEMA